MAAPGRLEAQAGILVAAAALLAACSRSPRAYQPPEAGVTVSAPAANPAAMATEEPEAPTVLSQALFSKRSELAVCFDTDVRSRLDGGRWTQQDRAEALQRMAADDAGSPVRGMTDVVIQQECGAAFADRLLLATCRGTGWLVSYYSFDMLKDDREMRDCLGSLHGSWWELPHDSEEYRRAHGRWKIERAREDLDRLGGP